MAWTGRVFKTPIDGRLNRHESPISIRNGLANHELISNLFPNPSTCFLLTDFPSNCIVVYYIYSSVSLTFIDPKIY